MMFSWVQRYKIIIAYTNYKYTNYKENGKISYFFRENTVFPEETNFFGHFLGDIAENV